MARMNSGIILAGQQPNFVNALTSGVLSGQAVNDARHAQDFRNALAQYGSGAYSGDQAARNALARFDPAAMQALDAGDLQQDATRLGMDATRQNMRIAEERLQLARQAGARAAAAQAAQLSAAQLAQERQELSGVLEAAQLAPDQATYEGFLTSQGLDPTEYPWEQRDLVAASILGAQEVLDIQAAQTPEVADVPAAVQTLQMRAEMAGLERGSPEYQAFMLSGGAADGPQVVVNAGDQVPEIGTIPQGFETFINDEGRREMRPILGGPEDVSQQTEAQQQQQTDTANLLVEDIGRARDIMDTATLPVTGLGAQTLALVGGTGAANMRALLDTIGANISFEYLNEMRRNSPTGGALGNVTERELQLLRATAGNLEQSQSPEQLRFNLDRLEQQLNEVIHGTPQEAPAVDFSTMSREQILGADLSTMNADELTAYLARMDELGI